ncbi:hypothetical protein [Streptomyces sp. MA5143a]|uniref:hypothetical protein n=1 Tax=Streptomyces sp. MA5143a TaxID=2083010 RepID=UPI000D1B4B68|nr:hypothetical protein [Streptomyces sp. MA5143a]SPF06078.1 hypothetical protein SMA5143A_6900 [Streptomyces sp. MA5143a]
MRDADDTHGIDGGHGIDDSHGIERGHGKAERHMTRGDGTHGGDDTLGGLTGSSALERDIALLLADAADEVRIGTAPYQAVVRGGRRRKARRWAVAAAVTVVLAGSTGALALAGAADGGRVTAPPAATGSADSGQRHLYQPQRTRLATWREQGRDWKVTVDCWDAPRTEKEAEKQLAAMALRGDRPTDVDSPAELTGRAWHFVHLSVGRERTDKLLDGEEWTAAGTDHQAFAMPTGGQGADGALKRLVIGEVAPTAQQVRVTWSDGTSVDVNRDTDLPWYEDLRNPRIVDAKGSPVSWFVALAPKGAEYESVKVVR